MMDYFVVFKQKLQEHFNEMQKNATHLFEVKVQIKSLENVENMIVVVVVSLLKRLVQ